MRKQFRRPLPARAKDAFLPVHAGVIVAGDANPVVAEEGDGGGTGITDVVVAEIA